MVVVGIDQLKALDVGLVVTELVSPGFCQELPHLRQGVGPVLPCPCHQDQHCFHTRSPYMHLQGAGSASLLAVARKEWGQLSHERWDQLSTLNINMALGSSPDCRHPRGLW